MPLIRLSDPSPMARVLRDEHSLVVHPVLDAPGGLNLLHPGHLPAKAVATGSPAAIVELIERLVVNGQLTRTATKPDRNF